MARLFLGWNFVEVGPGMGLVVRRHRLPNKSLYKEAMKQVKDKPKKKEKNVSNDPLEGKIGKIYMPDQKFEGLLLKDKRGESPVSANDR